MTAPNGKFIWYELATTDAAAAETFYKHVVGWGSQSAGSPEMPYTLFTIGEAGICGLMTLSEECVAAGIPAGWTGYIGVGDVDAKADQLVTAGGTIRRGPADIPDIGRFAAVADPQGVPFVLFRGSVDQPPPTFPPGTPGTIGWHELHTSDWQAAFAFYADQYGWTKGEAYDMGPMGIYQLFTVDGVAAGGMMTSADRPPTWQFYFNVEAIDAAIDRLTAGGGRIINGPMEVPGGSWIVNGLDPQGAVFALVAPKR
jgi:predicted enzyme related to lactoylglutathione lyase